jgi:hypothetical protein
MKPARLIWGQQSFIKASRHPKRNRQFLCEANQGLYEASIEYMKPKCPIWRQQGTYEASNFYMTGRPIWIQQFLYEDRNSYMKPAIPIWKQQGYMKELKPIWSQQDLYWTSNSCMKPGKPKLQTHRSSIWKLRIRLHPDCTLKYKGWFLSDKGWCFQ